ncbi:Uncharacterised protein [Mycobacteroides abscessus subsp. abscessus]|nr:Uncharacterised protein [Mycobacteroides abscessus subsp. abscessus]
MVMRLPGTGAWQMSHASRCRPASRACRLGALTRTAEGGSSYTVAPVSVVSVFNKSCAVSSVNNALARKAPS